jgi:hypothetical protein
MEIPVAAALKISGNTIKGSSHLNAWYKEVDNIIKQELIDTPILRHQPEVIEKIRTKLAGRPPDFIKGYITNRGNFINEPDIVKFIKNNPKLKRLFIQFLQDIEQVEEDYNSYFTPVYINSPSLNKFFNYIKNSTQAPLGLWGESVLTFEQFYMSYNDSDTVSKIMLYNQDRVLLLRKTNGKWHLPGGHVKNNETPAEGLERELKEETGIKNLKYKLGKRIGNLYLYKGETDMCNVRLSNEHIDFKWILPSEVSKYDLTNDTKSCIKYI